MRRLFVASVKMLFRDRQALFWALAFPIIFTAVFGLFDFGKMQGVKVAVVAAERSPVAEGIVSGLKAVKSFQVSEPAGLDETLRRLDGGKLDMVLSVPPGAAPLEIKLWYDQGNPDRAQVGLQVVRQVMNDMNLRLAGVRVPPLALRESGVSAKVVRYYDFLLPGLVAMGLMNFSIIGMSVAIARFREQRILRRIMATPLRPWKFLVAQVLARLVLALVQAGLIIAVGVFVFGAHIYGNVLWLFVLAAIANLVFLNLGFAVAGRAANADAAQGIGNVVAMPMMFLSGTFFPTDTLPAVMQPVVQYLPLTPLIDAMRKVSVDGLSITATGHQLLLLGAWVVGSLAIASRTFRFSEG